DRVGVVCLSPDHKKVDEKIAKLNLPMPAGGGYNMLETASGDFILSEGSHIVCVNKSKTQAYSLSFEKGKRPKINDVQHAENASIIISTDTDCICYCDIYQQHLLIKQAEFSILDKNYTNARLQTVLHDREKILWLGWFLRGLVFIPSSSQQFEFWRI